MRLIDAVLMASDAELWATLLIHADSSFVRAGRVRAAIALEYLAQAAAAFFSIEAWRSAAMSSSEEHCNAPVVKQGMLIAVPSLSSDVSHFNVGDRLLLHVSPASRMPIKGNGMVKFRGEVFVCSDSKFPDRWPTEDDAKVRAELSVYL